jgi:FtsP/CotA-like multicopper oxidase with cupredoxin domain
LSICSYSQTTACKVFGVPKRSGASKHRLDTVIAYPDEITRVKATFKVPGLFVWHCHIVEHEDNEMMRPYRVGP